MKSLNLAGQWTLSCQLLNKPIIASLPGCQYLALMDQNIMNDPFYQMNEHKALKWAEVDYSYSRQFNLTEDDHAHEHIQLRLSGVDTISQIYINGHMVKTTDNIHRIYLIDIKTYVKTGENHIQINFSSPLKYVHEKNDQDPININNGMSIKGISHIRKAQCHFGWDWGPVLPPIGVNGDLEILMYQHCRIDDIFIRQTHYENKVQLEITSTLTANPDQSMGLSAKLITPSGHHQLVQLSVDELTGYGTLIIEDPQLWWCHGLGDQPLYKILVTLSDGDEILDTLDQSIGLRTISLNTEADAYGNNFQFIINGVPIFAKGANWIPSDSFITRTSKEDLRYYLESAKKGNLNMLRIWGGGFYGSDDFYDLCDELGLLVWQDFMFACSAYPFYDEGFLTNVKKEVIDNVRRLRNHPSLALWCGNNEIDMMSMMWKRNKKLYQSTHEFFHDVLPIWVAAEDDVTPYWPGSPTSGINRPKPNSINQGDTHLWQVWHGMLPIEAFSKMPTRLCSEFGMESMPSKKAIKMFTDEENIHILDPVMLSHQKSVGGNQKILFYLLAKYREPTNFDDFTYLSQIVQSETIREATEGWKSQIGRCNGAIYWQFNDCWPVASWAGIDYSKTWKAVIYRNIPVNQMLTTNLRLEKGQAKITLVNEYPTSKPITCHYGIFKMDGSLVTEDCLSVKTEAYSAKTLWQLPLKTITGEVDIKDTFILMTLKEDGVPIFSQSRLLVKDRDANLMPGNYDIEAINLDSTHVELGLTSKTYMPYVFLESVDMAITFNDNFVDLIPGETYKIIVKSNSSLDADDLKSSLSLKCLNDLEGKGNGFSAFITRWKMRFHKHNLINWLAFKFM